MGLKEGFFETMDATSFCGGRSSRELSAPDLSKNYTEMV